MGRTPSPSLAIPRLAHLGPAIAWLRDRGVAPATIAAALGTSPGTVAVIDWRERRRRRRFPLVRPHDGADSDGVAANPRRVEWLDDELESIRWTHARVGDFAGALRALAQFRPQLGRPHSIALLRLLARWHEHRAWFAVHSGLTRSAIRASSAARTLYEQVYRESTDPLDLQHVGDAALIGSHAHLYVNEPAQSLALLKVYRAAAEAGSFTRAVARQH